MEVRCRRGCADRKRTDLGKSLLTGSLLIRDGYEGNEGTREGVIYTCVYIYILEESVAPIGI